MVLFSSIYNSRLRELVHFIALVNTHLHIFYVNYSDLSISIWGTKMPHINYPYFPLGNLELLNEYQL